MKQFKYFLFGTSILWGSSFTPVYSQPASSYSLEENLNQISHTDSQKLHDLFDEYWNWHLAENPDEASFLGYSGQHDQWPDFSKNAIVHRKHQLIQFIKTLDSIKSSQLTHEDKISYRILKRILEDHQHHIEFGSHYLLLNQLFGIHFHVPLIIESMPHKTVEDYKNILSRLRKVPGLFEQVIELLKEGVRLGITPPRIAIQGVPQQLLNQIVDPLQSSLIRSFTINSPSIDPNTQSSLLQEAIALYETCVIPALHRLHAYVVQDYLPNCRESIAFSDLPNGKEWYLSLVRSSTTTELTPEEIHAIGLKEVERIYQEMLSIIKSVQFQGDFKQFLSFLKTDPQFFFSSREEILQGYQALTQAIEAKLPLLFSQLPTLPYEVVPIPSYSEASHITAYYCPGSLNDQRPGYFFINTLDPQIRPKWEMEPLSLHEAVPGHHLQITLAQELNNIPVFRKHTEFTAYVEGWGLYAESLGSELGFYQDPYSQFGRLSYEMLRAIRLVVDTGMHVMGWSRNQAIQFFQDYIGVSDHEIISEVDRYLVMPGQALAYKIGELKIKELREIANQRLGNQFDIREFHQKWLQHGTVPLEIAEEEIFQWLNQSSQ